MKIFKLSQAQAQAPLTNPEVAEAMQNLQYCIQTINASLVTLEKYHVDKLFKKNSFIEELQSGNLVKINQSNVQELVNAISKIVQIIPKYNESMKILVDNGADFRILTNQAITLLQQGATVENNALSLFQTALPSAIGIQLPSNLG